MALPPRTIDLDPTEWKRTTDYGVEPTAWGKSLKAAKNQALIKSLGQGAYRFMNPLGTLTNVLDVGFQVMDWLNPGVSSRGNYKPPFPFTKHWGRYDCGSTPYINGTTGTGFLNEGTYACLGGQVYTFTPTNSPNNVVGQPLVIPANVLNGKNNLTLGRWNGNVLAGRMTLIEHWFNGTGNFPNNPQPFTIPYYRNRVPTGANLEPAPVPFSPVTVYPKGGGSRHRPSRPPYFTGPKDRVPQLPKPRERKMKFKPSAAHNIYGGLTEIQDALGCLEKNTSGERPRYKGLHQRIMVLANALAENPRSLNLGGFVSCMVKENIEDAVIGKANQLANRITQNKDWVRPVGIGAGNWATRMR